LKKFVYFLSGLILLIITSCGLLSNDEDEYAVARVGGNYLYENDLSGLNFDDANRDSSVIIQTFIDNWVKEQLLLRKALQNLNEKQTDFEEQLKNYKSSLVIFAYENQLIKQKLDTNVTSGEIAEYYEANKANFELKTKVLEARFIKIINSAPSKDSMEYWLFSRKDQFYEDLKDYCTQFANQCQIDTSVWFPISDLLRIFPPTVSIEDVKLSLNQNVISDSTETLLVDINDMKNAGESSPIYLVEDQIKSIIRNKRKLQLLAKVKEEIYEDATLKKEYEVFN